MNAVAMRVHRQRVLALIFCCVVLALSGCGFHLRGAVSLPAELSRTYIEGLSPYGEFSALLRRQLRANGIDVVEDSAQSTATLRVRGPTGGKRVLAVDENGKVLEYELFTSVSFEVRGQDNALLLENQTINLTRDFIFDENDVLGKVEEERLLLEDMRKDAVRLMIYRLQVIGKA